MRRIPPARRPVSLLSFAVCATGATLWGCRTTYEATAPRPVRLGDIQVSIERIRGGAVALVRVTDLGTAIGDLAPLRAAQLGAMNQQPCASSRLLAFAAVADVTNPNPSTPPLLRSDESIEVQLPTAIDALSRPGLTLDLAFDDGASGCARLPLTSVGDEVLWRGSSGWGASGHLTIEWPWASAAGIGGGLTGELRFHYPVRLAGDWRLSFGVPFGWTGCRGDCPGLEWYSDSDGSHIADIFVNVGATASIARAVSVGRWLFLPAVGFRTSVYSLAATSGYKGDRLAFLAGPFVSLGVLRTSRDSPPGFAPSTWRRGVEVTLGALRAYDRAPEGIAWLLGLGWTFGDAE
ncbi:MAG: hypothetical protein ABJA82_01620 [Myxococcales bacterium]